MLIGPEPASFRVDSGVRGAATDADAHALSVPPSEAAEKGAAEAATARAFSVTTLGSSRAPSSCHRRWRHSEGASLVPPPPARDTLAERTVRRRLRPQRSPAAANMRTSSFFTFEFMSAYSTGLLIVELIADMCARKKTIAP